MYSAKEVAEGVFDQQYLQFFQTVKEKNLKVIFRTMHEMNGGWYPRSSNPKTFKEAWIHVWELSRKVGLDQHSLLFDFSVNHRDMPTKSKPSQTAVLYSCTSPKPLTKAQQLAEQQRWEKLSEAEKEAEKKAEEERKKTAWEDCPKFEDYYPGDTYVDVVGFTFYNRGKATSNRQWLTPTEILFDPQWQTYERLQALKKPLIIDEVGTTAVRYSEKYNAESSRTSYLHDTQRKETWLGQLQSFLVEHSEILAAVYFNVDYTYGLQFPTVGEADRAILNPAQGKMYEGFFKLYQHSELHLERILKYFMNATLLEIEGREIIVPNAVKREVSMISELLNKKIRSEEEKAALVDRMIALDLKDWKIQQSLQILKGIYPKTEK